MINIRIEDHRPVVCEVDGTPVEIAKEFCSVIKGLYACMLVNSPKAAAHFKAFIQYMVSDPESPLWDGKLHGECIYARRTIKK